MAMAKKLLFFLLCSLPVWSIAQDPSDPSLSAPAISGAENEGSSMEGETQASEQMLEVNRISDIQNFLKPFEYQKEDGRDPFENQGRLTPLEPGSVYGPFLPLQTYRLDEFQLKGLLWGIKKPIAVFRAPDGKDYRLGIKDYIGENFGYIAQIREREVVVIQTIESNNERYSMTKVIFLK